MNITEEKRYKTPNETAEVTYKNFETYKCGKTSATYPYILAVIYTP
jgi:hypothetical protein